MDYALDELAEALRREEQEEAAGAAEKRLRDILANTLDEIGEAEEFERKAALKAFLEENVTHSAKSIKAEQDIQRILNLVKKTTFWEFRVDYLVELGMAIHNARYVEMLSVEPAVIEDAVAFMCVLTKDWHENVREAAAMQLAKAAKADDTIAVSAILDALKDFTPKVRESASASLVSMTTKGDENIIAEVSEILENDFKDIRDCALQVTLQISTAERAVEVVGSLLAHKRIDLRLWAVQALGSLAFKPIQMQHEQGGSTCHSECGVMGDGPELDTLRRAKADPKKEIQRLREEGIGTLEAARRTGIAQAVDKASMIHRGCNMEMKPAYLYMEFVLRKISDSVHDPNWQVQRSALAVLCRAVDLGESDLVAQCCKYSVPTVFRNKTEKIINFITDLYAGVKTESNVTCDGRSWVPQVINSDALLIKERVHRAEQDIASSIAIFNTLSPAIGGICTANSRYQVKKGTIDLVSVAQRSDALDATRSWIGDIGIKPMDVILCGPQRRSVQVTDTVPLQGGLEIYGRDKHGNRVYIPANSSLPDHQYVLTADRQGGGDKGDGEVVINTIIEPKTLPVISSAAVRQLPRGHKFHTAAAYGGGIRIGKTVARSHQSFVAASNRPRGNRFADMLDSIQTAESSAMLSDLGSPSNGSRILPLEENDVYKSIYDHSKRERPEYGYAGNRCFTPEARFTGIMDFLTQSPEHMHASYNKKKLGTFYKEDMAANRKHYMDPLDNNQLPTDQSLLPQPAHVPRVASPLAMSRGATPVWNSRDGGTSHDGTPAWNTHLDTMGSRMGTAGSPGASRLNTAGSRINTAGSTSKKASKDGKDNGQSYAEMFSLDDMKDELDEFMTFEVPQPSFAVGRPPSPKYTKSVRRGERIVLTAERAQSFLHDIMDKQVQQLRAQTFGVGTFETDIPNYHRAGGPSPDQIFDKIYKENHKESMYADSIFGRRRALRSQPSTTGGGRMGATFAKSGN